MEKKAHEILVDRFLDKARTTCGDIARILRTTTYKIDAAHVLVRAATSMNSSGRYFYGLKYAAIEELVNLENSFVAFICADISQLVVIPAAELFANLDHISRREDGAYRITIDSDLNIALKGKGNRLDCSGYINRWDFFSNPPAAARKIAPAAGSAEESLHAVLQGRLIEIGNLRKFRTFCPDKRKTFNNRKLSDLTTLSECPNLQWSDYGMLRRIDVLWFEESGKHYLPKYAFEVELSTRVWSGVVRMGTLSRYSDVKMYVVSNDIERYQQAVGTMTPELSDRYAHLSDDALGKLHTAEKGLVELRQEVGL